MQLLVIKKLEGTITLKSGLHIGSGNMEMHIGGTDSPVIKHPHTLEPYIPGSSLKGKVRSLLELESGLVAYTSGNVVSGKTFRAVEKDEKLKEKCEAILRIFGSGAADVEDLGFGPTRVSFSDCYLDRTWLEEARKLRLPLTEEKSENKIDRIKGVAEHPRFIERVPEGTKFAFLLTYKIFDNIDETNFNNVLLKGLKLLEMDTLGGSGSRGYGRVEISFNDPELNATFRSLLPFAKA